METTTINDKRYPNWIYDPKTPMEASDKWFEQQPQVVVEQKKDLTILEVLENK